MSAECTNRDPQTGTSSWVQASGGTYNLVEKNRHNHLSGAGAPGTPAIAMSTSGVYQGGGGGGSGQVGNITVPVAEGMVLNISLGAVTPPGTTVAYGTSVEINGIQVITCNGANGNTSGMDGGNGATLQANVFCSYSCGRSNKITRPITKPTTAPTTQTATGVRT